jgi:adenylosuccinate synthase
MVTTPFDIIQNHNVEAKNNHGTVGVGFGTTIQRNDDHYHLYVRDLFFPKILEAKLKNILNYYHYVTPLNSNSQKRYDEFINACKEFVATYTVIDRFRQIPNIRNKDLIFEGGQGIMLDQEHGFFPNVTRSYTTSRNAMEFILKNNLDTRTTKTYYVTRAYQTRHGHGYMSNEGMDISYIKPNPNETNVDTGYQGVFRKTVLDLNLLIYALSCDIYYNPYSEKILVITCLDQVDDKTQIPITANDELLKLSPKEIGTFLNINNVIGCNSEEGF